MSWKVHVRFGGKLSETYFSNKARRWGLILRIKQEALAYALGDDWTQKKVSLLEGQETIDEGILKQVAEILKVTPEVIKNFDVDTAVNFISNTFTDFKDNASAINYNSDLTFNPIDKLVELYERLLASEREKVELLRQQSK